MTAIDPPLASPSEGTRPVRVLLADDHQLLRQALHRALEEAGMEIVGEAADGAEAIRLMNSAAPDIVIMDVSMPVLDGIEATRRIHAAAPDLPVVVLTMHGEERLRREAIDAGAAGFLTKDVSMADVVKTVRDAAGGDVDLSQEIASTILSELRAEGTRPIESPLSPREEEVLQLIADGLRTSEVAATLFISGKTVKNHLASIYAKLGAHDRTQAVLAAVRIGIVRIR